MVTHPKRSYRCSLFECWQTHILYNKILSVFIANQFFVSFWTLETEFSNESRFRFECLCLSCLVQVKPSNTPKHKIHNKNNTYTYLFPGWQSSLRNRPVKCHSCVTFIPGDMTTFILVQKFTLYILLEMSDAHILHQQLGAYGN